MLSYPQVVLSAGKKNQVDQGEKRSLLDGMVREGMGGCLSKPERASTLGSWREAAKVEGAADTMLGRVVRRPV